MSSSEKHVTDLHKVCFRVAEEMLGKLDKMRTLLGYTREDKRYVELLDALKARAEQAPMITASAGAAASLAYMISHAAKILEVPARKNIVEYLWNEGTGEPRVTGRTGSIDKTNLAYLVYLVYLARVLKKLGHIHEGGDAIETVFHNLLEAAVEGRIPYRLLLSIEEFSKNVFVILINHKVSTLERD